MQHTLRFAVIALTCITLLPVVSCGEEPKKPAEEGKSSATQSAASTQPPSLTDKSTEEGFMSLFNGKDLTGWVITTCKAGVEDGSLVLQEGNGFVRADKLYGDYILELDWKNRQADKYDSGVYFRSEKLKLGKRYPDKYQINLLKGEEGTIVQNKQVKVVGNATVKNVAKPGEWNHFRLSVVGAKAELEINGQPAWKVEGIAPAVGYVGLQCEVPGGGQFEFKNIRIKPLTPPVEE